MQIELKMPDLAATEDEITVVRWFVQVGETVAQGQPLLEVETDKASMEVEAYLAGTVCEILARPGDVVTVGMVIARLETASAVASALAPAAPAPKQGMFARNRQAAGVADGPAERPAPALSAAARTAARRLQESWQTVPHFALQTSANAEPMQARREAASPKVAWDAFFVYAVSRALVEFPRLGCRFEGERLVPQGTDSIGVAVDLDGDLYVIPVAAPAGKPPEAISAEIRAAVAALRSGQPETQRISRNLLTVTNLGMTGVEAFTAIINPPEAAILAVGRVAPAVVAVDGQSVVQQRVTLTLSVDHRVAGGKYAAGFLDRVVAELESLA